MDTSARPGWIAQAVALVAAAAATFLVAYGVGRFDWWGVVLAAALAGSLFGLVAFRYARWARWRSTRFHVGAAFVGSAITVAGACLLRAASSYDKPSLATAGVAIVLAGLTPVAVALSTEGLTRPGGGVPWRAYLLPLGVNFVFAALSAGVALLVIGVRWWLALAVVVAWTVASWVVRVGRWTWARDRRAVYWVVVGLGAFIGLYVVVVTVIGVGGWSLSDIAVVLVAVGVAAALGCIEVIAAWLRNLRDVELSRATWIMAGAAVVGLVIGAVLMHARLGDDVSPWVTWGAIVGCALVGAGFVFRVQGFLLVALLGGLAVWAVVDRTDHSATDPHPAAEQRLVVLGDSYTSGEGAVSFLAETNVEGANNCRRSSSSYAYLVADELGMGLDFVACSGATARQLYADGQIGSGPADVPGSLPQIRNEFTTNAPAAVVLSIGGNDAYFGNLGRTCVAPGSCDENREIFFDRLPFVEREVAEALVAVANRFPDSPVVVVPYPRMLADELPGDARTCVVPFNGSEYRFLAEFIPALDATIQRAIIGANAMLADAGSEATGVIWFADGESAYAGNQLCAPGVVDQPINRIALAPPDAVSLARRLDPTKWTHNGFHPTAAGHRLMADALLAWLPDHVPGFGGVTDFEPTTAETTDAPPAESSAPSTPEQVLDEWVKNRVVDAFATICLPMFVLLLSGLLTDVVRHWVWSRTHGRPAPAVDR